MLQGWCHGKDRQSNGFLFTGVRGRHWRWWGDWWYTHTRCNFTHIHIFICCLTRLMSNRGIAEMNTVVLILGDACREKSLWPPSSNLDYEDNDEGGNEGKDSRSAAAEEDGGSGSWLRCALQWAPLSRSENTTACSHEEEMRGWERSDSEGGCRGVKCDRPSISVGRRKWASVRVSAISRLFSV